VVVKGEIENSNIFLIQT